LTVLAIGMAALAATAVAQQAPSTTPSATPPPSATPAPAAPTTTPPAPAPAGQALNARVTEVVGTVEYAPEGADALDKAAWKPVTVGLELPASTQIRTGIRSRCVLIFGEAPDQTVISLRAATLASIRDFRRTQDEQRVYLGLGYGTIRGGSSEGTLRADVVIDSNVATLAKRGTEGYELEVWPVKGIFRISLAQSGLVEALLKATNQKKFVQPGEYTNTDTIATMWINQALFDRAVQFFEDPALTDAELDFQAMQAGTGVGHLDPDAAQLYDRWARRFRTGPVGQVPTIPPAVGILPATIIFQRPPSLRPDGNFGFGPLRVLRGIAK
jgi:hypothetical protein